ncbi:MAG: rhomboid family intramembrane serine protease [Candidatus Bathyarchaeia archaeon]
MSKNSKAYMPTFMLIAVNVAVYGYTCFLSGDLTMSEAVGQNYGQYNLAVFNGEVWRLFTAMFIHADIAHIVGNMLFLLIFGLRSEKLFDLKEYFLIYFLSGLAGGFLTLFLGPNMLSVGASGAIFGMIGASTIYARRAIGQSIVTALLYSFFLLIINISQNVNVFAHLGGLIAGLLIGYMLATTRKPRQIVTYEYSYPSSYGT